MSMFLICFLVGTGMVTSILMWITVIASIIRRNKDVTIAKYRNDGKHFCKHCWGMLDKEEDIYCHKCGRKIIMWEKKKDV